ncbi:MAG: sensor histidine kinase [Chloroflexi bacterium CFX7]|nr:MAG: sensor histidine kinase [bacterium]MCE7927002.1 sensor histidine kinase [Chloroflexi bacterium CFX7]MCK6563275.1 HAMP domain-containing histidine kinase [Dehalococcoidia bacterium]MCL4232120.1 HAMP domain-containing histidine kinase [Dehalococcoidia bacterium]
MGSLQVRLFLTYLIIIVVTLGLAALTLYLQVGGYRDSLSYNSLEDLGRLVDLQAETAMEDSEPPSGADLLLNLRNFVNSSNSPTDEETSLAVVDAAGRVVPGGWASSVALDEAVVKDIKSPDATTGPAGARAPTRCRLEVPGRSEQLCVSIPLSEAVAAAFPGSGATDLVVAEPAASLTTVFGDLTPRLVFSGLIGVAAALVLGFLLSQSVAAPLRNIARAARSVARGSYRQRVPATGPTEVRELASTFNRMTGEVQRSQQTLRDFLANISHELKTPLTSIRGFSEAIQDGTIDDPEGILRSARVISTESSRVLRLVEELLDLSRIESGQVSMQQEEIELRELFEHVREIFALRADEGGVNLEIASADGLRIRGDFDRLEQVLNNLLDNALRHTPAGGTVRLASYALQPGVAQVTVSDTGKGIPPEDVVHLFERFYRAKDSARANGQPRGYGLGLAISREIVRAHGGDIWATSEVGRGTMFIFTLPTSSRGTRKSPAR